MTQLTPVSKSKLTDSGGVPQIGDRGAAVTAAAAATVAAVTYTGTNPVAPTDYTALTNYTEPVAKAEGETLSAALATLADEAIAMEIIQSAMVVDDLAQDVAIDALAVDLALMRTAINAIIERLEAHGLLANN